MKECDQAQSRCGVRVVLPCLAGRPATEAAVSSVYLFAALRRRGGQDGEDRDDTVTGRGAERRNSRTEPCSGSGAAPEKRHVYGGLTVPRGTLPAVTGFLGLGHFSIDFIGTVLAFYSLKCLFYCLIILP